MGYTPQEVEEMSLWQFLACVDGHRSKNDDVDAPSAEEYRSMVERLN